MENFDIFLNYFSKARIDRYLIATSLNKDKSISLYKSNLIISKSFYPLIGVVEVVLRNQLNKELSKYYNDPDWIMNKHFEFTINSKSSLNNSNSILANQSFAFWTSLFEKKHYKSLKGRPIKIFKYLPENVGRIEVVKILNNIRRFRNRIYHNEPICFKEKNIDLQMPTEIYYSIIQIINWINPKLRVFIEDVDTVMNSINDVNESFIL